MKLSFRFEKSDDPFWVGFLTGVAILCGMVWRWGFWGGWEFMFVPIILIGAFNLVIAQSLHVNQRPWRFYGSAVLIASLLVLCYNLTTYLIESHIYGTTVWFTLSIIPVSWITIVFLQWLQAVTIAGAFAISIMYGRKRLAQ